MPAPFALSLQDLAPIADGTSTVQAMAETVLLAQEADGQTLLFNSADFAEGRDAFLAKRKPVFTGN